MTLKIIILFSINCRTYAIDFLIGPLFDKSNQIIFNLVMKL